MPHDISIVLTHIQLLALLDEYGGYKMFEPADSKTSLVALGLLDSVNHQRNYQITAKGRKMVDMLMATPLPERDEKWRDPRIT